MPSACPEAHRRPGTRLHRSPRRLLRKGLRPARRWCEALIAELPHSRLSPSCIPAYVCTTVDAAAEAYGMSLGKFVAYIGTSAGPPPVARLPKLALAASACQPKAGSDQISFFP